MAPEELTDIRSKIPLHELAKKMGMSFVRENDRYAYALCPFHHDTHPSFVIDKIKHSGRCFSSACSDLDVSDHIKMVQQYEHLPRELAIDRIYQLIGEERPADSDYSWLGRVMERLHTNITMDKPDKFFKGRGIDAGALTKLIVGYSPSYEWFKSAISDVPPDRAAVLELMRPELFDDAIIYPLFDALGRVAGFKSRPFKQISTMRYIGTSKNFPLRPSRLYGIHLVSSKQRQVVMVEGPNDVLGLISAGLPNAVGLLSSNLYQMDQYLSDHGFSDAVFMADGDDAGRIAMMKAPPTIKVIQVPQGDPDEYAHQVGLGGILDLVNQAKYPIEIQLEARIAKMPSTMTGKITLIKGLAKDFSEGLPPILLSVIQQRVAEAVGISTEEVASIFSLVDPDSEKLERRLISHLSDNGPLVEDIKAVVTPSMFANPRLRRQATSLFQGLSPDDTIIKVEGLTEGDIKKFTDISRRRKIKEILLRTGGGVFNTAISLDDLMARAMSQLADATTNDVEIVGAEELFSEGLHTVIERSMHPGRHYASFGAGFATLDELLHGVRPNAMYVLAATQGVGKSALAFEWALNMACRNADPTPVLWISLEMSRMEMADRAMAKLTGLPIAGIQAGGLNKNHVDALQQGIMQYAHSPLYMADCGATNISQIVALVRKMKVTKGIKVVFLDYMQLVEGGERSQSMYERMGHVSRMIKSSIAMDRSINVPVVAIAQLSRQAAKVDTPGAEHIAESYKISQDADVFMALRRRGEAEIAEGNLLGEPLGNMALNIDKNRAGRDKVVVGLMIDRTNLQIREVMK